MLRSFDEIDFKEFSQADFEIGRFPGINLGNMSIFRFVNNVLTHSIVFLGPVIIQINDETNDDYYGEEYDTPEKCIEILSELIGNQIKDLESYYIHKRE